MKIFLIILSCIVSINIHAQTTANCNELINLYVRLDSAVMQMNATPDADIKDKVNVYWPIFKTYTLFNKQTDSTIKPNILIGLGFAGIFYFDDENENLVIATFKQCFTALANTANLRFENTKQKKTGWILVLYNMHTNKPVMALERTVNAYTNSHNGRAVLRLKLYNNYLQ
jgi:hypothetical protein